MTAVFQGIVMFIISPGPTMHSGWPGLIKENVWRDSTTGRTTAVDVH